VRVLGLDPSLTNYGWAVHDTSFPLGSRSRCAERGRFQTSPSTLFVERYVDLRTHLGSLIERVRPDRVGLEMPVYGEMYSEGMYGLYLYTCEALHEHRQDVSMWTNGQIKAHARDSVGRPDGWKMGKEDMVEAAKDDAGGGRWNHNEADGYLAARLAARFWCFRDGLIRERDLTPTERKYFLEIQKPKRGKRAGETILKGALYREDERYFLWSSSSE
jgi:Holliday junction resolvasome RuvABC endonuclease subunit